MEDILSKDEQENLFKILEDYKKEYDITNSEIESKHSSNGGYKRDTLRNTVIKNIQIVEDLLLNGIGTLDVQKKYNISRVGLGQSVLSIKNFNIGRKITPTMLKKTYEHNKNEENNKQN